MSAAKYEMRCSDCDLSKNQVFHPGLNPRFSDRREPCHHRNECEVFENCDGKVDSSVICSPVKATIFTFIKKTSVSNSDIPAAMSNWLPVAREERSSGGATTRSAMQPPRLMISPNRRIQAFAASNWSIAVWNGAGLPRMLLAADYPSSFSGSKAISTSQSGASSTLASGSM